MTLSRQQAVFGIHSVCAYNPDTLLPYGIIKVLGTMTFNLTTENIPLQGGSSRFPWEIENGVSAAEGSFLAREVPDWIFEAFLGSAATTNAAEANAGATTLTNIYGTSVVNASTGIATVGVKSGSEADVKGGLYVVKAVSSTTVDVYHMSDVDFLRGTDLAFVNDSLKITSSALTITASTAVTIPSCGLELTGGSGTIGMTTGDTAWFDARGQNEGSTTVTVGAANEIVPTIGLFCAAQQKGNNEIFMLDIMRAKVGGFPFSFNEKAWMESEVPIQAFYDTTRNGVFRYMRIKGT